MKRPLLLILFFAFGAQYLAAQPLFKTVVPQKPVVEGTSFLVQYVLQDADKYTSFRAPSFNGLRVVNGPNIYSGTVNTSDGKRPVQNYVYTLESFGTGKFRIRGATAMLNGKAVTSSDATVVVISASDAARLEQSGKGPLNSGYFLAPGEDPYDKIRKNLFVTVSFDRKECFVGQPVVATYKLFSRLESRSDIIKNPGFYGFTVYDMINLQDKAIATEEVGGKSFDVHTIRKVQLYPMQAGQFTIDPMEIKNEVEFSRSSVNRKPEQEIVEGMLGSNDDETPAANSERYETTIRTAPTLINVKALNEKNKPELFNGAVGRFTIQALIKKDSLAKGEQGILEIIVAGRGNFTQITPPLVHWPSGMEGFEPSIKDSLDKATVPLSGKRVFQYPFVSNVAGNYNIASVSFGFFDPDSGRFRTINSLNQSVNVLNIKRPGNHPQQQRMNAGNPVRDWWPLALAVLVVMILVVRFLFMKEKKKPAEVIVAPDNEISIEEIFAPALLLTEAADQDFYTALREGLWKYFGNRFKLEGSGYNKDRLFRMMKERNVDPGLITDITEIFRLAESGIYTGAVLTTDKQELLLHTKETIRKVDRQLHSAYL